MAPALGLGALLALLALPGGSGGQPKGLHTLQWLHCCDFLSYGSVCGSFWSTYNGQDFLSFELRSGSFVAANGAAQITKRKWEHDGIVVEGLRNYLENICPKGLRKYIRYGWEVLEQKKPIWNSTPDLIAVSINTPIIIIIIFGLIVWKLQPGKRESNGYDLTPTRIKA